MTTPAQQNSQRVNAAADRYIRKAGGFDQIVTNTEPANLDALEAE